MTHNPEERPSLPEIEAALDSGRIFAKMSNGNLWRVRRNGKTKRWKTRPEEFRIPIKAGLKSCAYLNEETRWGEYFLIEAPQ